MNSNINLLDIYNNQKDFFQQILNNRILNPNLLLQKYDKNKSILHILLKKRDFINLNKILSLLHLIDDELRHDILNIQDNKGNTIMHICVKNGLFDIATELDKLGVQKNISNKYNEIIETTETTENSKSRSISKEKLDNIINNIMNPGIQVSESESSSASSFTLETTSEIIITSNNNMASSNIQDKGKGKEDKNFFSNMLNEIFIDKNLK